MIRNDDKPRGLYNSPLTFTVSMTLEGEIHFYVYIDNILNLSKLKFQTDYILFK